MYNDEEVMIRNLIMMCCLIYPRTNAMILAKSWERHKVLVDYDMPPYATLQTWVKEFKSL